MLVTRTAAAVAGAAVGLPLLAGTALAGHVAGHGLFNGGAQTQRLVATGTNADVTSTTSFATLGGAERVVSVPRFSSRLVTARFTAESQCTGSFGWCSVRLVARNLATGATTELSPRSGSDFAFDSASGDNWESNSVARTARLGAGRYAVSAQRAVVAGATSFRLDDWTFEVDVNG